MPIVSCHSPFSLKQDSPCTSDSNTWYTGTCGRMHMYIKYRIRPILNYNIHYDTIPCLLSLMTYNVSLANASHYRLLTVLKQATLPSATITPFSSTIAYCRTTHFFCFKIFSVVIFQIYACPLCWLSHLLSVIALIFIASPCDGCIRMNVPES